MTSTPSPTARSHVASPEVEAAQNLPVVLFVSSNGAGMGHLTRLLSYATRLEGRALPYFHSLSQAVPVAGRFGYPYEYTPSAGASGIPVRVWNTVFVQRLSSTLQRVAPQVVVFDGTWPYAGIRDLRAAFPQVRWIWSRRGMWRPGKAKDQIAKTAWFEEVVEPGDLSSAYDRGATSSAPSVRVGPVTLIERHQLLSREAARAQLGLSQHERWALLSLGAGNINDTESEVDAVVSALMRLGVRPCTAVAEISGSRRGRAELVPVSAYPLAPLYSAFDVVVSAAGYNSFHELMRMGVPSLFVPNTHTSLDDQTGRAQYAADRGWAHTTSDLSGPVLDRMLGELLTDGRRMVDQVAQEDPGNGAVQVADVIMEVLSR